MQGLNIKSHKPDLVFISPGNLLDLVTKLYDFSSLRQNERITTSYEILLLSSVEFRYEWLETEDS